MDTNQSVQNFCAVLLIVSSIALAFLQAFSLHDIANGVLLYIAQAFLLAASIFGLDAFVNHIAKIIRNGKKEPAEGNSE